MALCRGERRESLGSEDERTKARGLWPIAEDVMWAVDGHYRAAMNRVIGEMGLDRRTFFLLRFALRLEPECASVARLQASDPYSPPKAFERELAAAADRGFLRQVARVEYQLTGKGRRAVEEVDERGVRAPLAGFEPIPRQDLKRLAALLHQLVESSVAAPEPPAKFGTMRSRLGDPGQGAPLLLRIEQYLNDLYEFRADAHRAAWQPYGPGGPVWEALTYLWREEPVAALNQRFALRGNTREACDEALQELVQRGWVDEEAGRYTVTEKGRALRQEVEDETDRISCAPWACLSEGEMRELGDLLVQLRDSLGQAQA